jgi:hypothetical protein
MNKLRTGVSASIVKLIQSQAFFSGSETFVPQVGNLKRRLNTRLLRATYVNLTYQLYQPTMALSAWINDVLSHRTDTDETSLSYNNVRITQPVRRVPLPVLERLTHVESSLAQWKREVGVPQVQQLVKENAANQRALTSMLADVKNLKQDVFVVGGANKQLMESLNAGESVALVKSEYAFLPTGRRGVAGRTLVAIKRNTRGQRGTVAVKIRAKVEEMRKLDIPVSFSTLKAVGFGTDSIRAYFKRQQ